MAELRHCVNPAAGLGIRLLPATTVLPRSWGFPLFDQMPVLGAMPAQSDLAMMGRYILTPDVFQILAQTQPGARGEIQPTDAIAGLGEAAPASGAEFTGDLMYVGTRAGRVATNIRHASNHCVLRQGLSGAHVTVHS